MDEINIYLVLDKISARMRNILSLMLILTGYALQIASHNFLIGLPFIIGCLILNLIKGINIKKESASEYKWEEVTQQKLEQVYSHCLRVKKFKSAGIGCAIALIIGSIIFFISCVPFLSEMGIRFPFGLITAIIDSIILFAGLFASGNKSAWMPGNLDLKVDIVRRFLTTHPALIKDRSLTLIPYLEIGKTKTGAFPNDARFLVKFSNAPDSFIGVQGQISINNVKSTAYPYFYTVIIAKPDFGLLEKLGHPILSNITIEQKKTTDVDVVVIRQTTTKTSGYHTNSDTQSNILSKAIELARAILAATSETA